MFASANEIHHNEMEDGVSKQEVGEGSLWGDGQKISFVLWVDLDTKTHCENKRAHARDEAREKAIEWKGADEETVEELQGSS